MSEENIKIKEPGEEIVKHDCDCDLLKRYKALVGILGSVSCILFMGCFLMGWALSNRTKTIEVLNTKLQKTPTDVLAKLIVTPDDVRKEVVGLGNRLDRIEKDVQSIKSKLNGR